MNILNEIFEKAMSHYEAMCDAVNEPNEINEPNEQIEYIRGEDMTPEWIEENVERLM